MPTATFSEIKTLYDAQGYVVVTNLFDPKLRADLEAACGRVIPKTRDGSWPHRRTVGKQFPPYGEDKSVSLYSRSCLSELIHWMKS